MQLAAPEALDIASEPAEVLRLYGLDHGKSSFDKQINPLEETDYFGRKCLAARRLLERGVRFVQIWSGNDNGFSRRNLRRPPPGRGRRRPGPPGRPRLCTGLRPGPVNDRARRRRQADQLPRHPGLLPDAV